MRKPYFKSITLGPDIMLEDLVSVVRHGARVESSEDYRKWVNRSWALVEQWVDQNCIMYGVTTGFGASYIRAISEGETAQLQRNITPSHLTSVGEPLKQEQARATMLMVLQNLGQGYSGMRLIIPERYREFLNRNLVPRIPREGSVGYLCPEAHMALVLIGEGKAYFDGRLLSGAEALEEAGIEPIELCAEEGPALTSGTTSAIALVVPAPYDLLGVAKTADVIAAITPEASKGLIRAFDDRAMRVRLHPQQGETAANIRDVLADSEVIDHCRNACTQDMLPLRCVPQLHGVAKKILLDARRTLEIEINPCCDNPIIWSEPGKEDAISVCNPDSSYVGIEIDSACIAATCLAEISERRNNRMIDETLLDSPWFLTKNPGLNFGLAIPQYAQAGLLGDMRMPSTPSMIDNTSTCGNQEDYMAMGYNAAKKSVQIAEKPEYTLVVELPSTYESQVFLDPSLVRSPVTARILAEIG